MKFANVLKILLSIIIGELVLVVATTVAQEVLFDGIGLSSPLPELLIGGFATFIAAILSGFVARIILKKPVKIVAIVLSIFITIETSYLTITDKTADPVWFDILAGFSLIIGVWLGFYAYELLRKFKKIS